MLDATLHSILRRLEHALAVQLDSIILQARFQALRAAWLSICELAQTITSKDTVRIRLLPLSWSEVTADCTGTADIDATLLYQKMVADEYQQAGGEPYNLILLDYPLGLSDLSKLTATLSRLSEIAHAGFFPCFFNIVPNSVMTDQHLNTLTQAIAHPDFLGIFSQLRRHPYYHKGSQQHVHTQPSRCPNGWSSILYPVAILFCKCYERYGWFTTLPTTTLTRESQDELQSRNLWSPHIAPHDPGGKNLNLVEEDPQRNHYSLAGVRSLAKGQHLPSLELLLSICRFVHCINKILREQIGGTTQTAVLEDTVIRWLRRYCADNAYPSHAGAPCYPLRRAVVSVALNKTDPLHWQCEVNLVPNLAESMPCPEMVFTISHRSSRTLSPLSSAAKQIIAQKHSHG